LVMFLCARQAGTPPGGEPRMRHRPASVMQPRDGDAARTDEERRHVDAVRPGASRRVPVGGVGHRLGRVLVLAWRGRCPAPPTVAMGAEAERVPVAAAVVLSERPATPSGGFSRRRQFGWRNRGVLSWYAANRADGPSSRQVEAVDAIPVVELGGVLGLPDLFLPAGRYTGCRTAVRSAVVLALGAGQRGDFGVHQLGQHLPGRRRLRPRAALSHVRGEG